MSTRDPFGGESNDDTLLVLLGQYWYRRNPSSLEEDERFMNWLAREVRRGPPSPDDWDADRVRRVRRRVLQRALSERLGVCDGGREPGTREVAMSSFSRALDAASRVRCAPLTALAVAAGEGRELWDEECDRWVELPTGLRRGRYVALGVAGDSMIPLLHPGDTILVRLGPDLRRGTVVVARRGDDAYVVKRVRRVREHDVELVSLNPAYEAMLIPRDDRAILGTVVMRWCSHDDVVVPAVRQA